MDIITSGFAIPTEGANVGKRLVFATLTPVNEAARRNFDLVIAGLWKTPRLSEHHRAFVHYESGTAVPGQHRRLFDGFYQLSLPEAVHMPGQGWILGTGNWERGAELGVDLRVWDGANSIEEQHLRFVFLSRGNLVLERMSRQGMIRLGLKDKSHREGVPDFWSGDPQTLPELGTTQTLSGNSWRIFLGQLEFDFDWVCPEPPFQKLLGEHHERYGMDPPMLDSSATPNSHDMDIEGHKVSEWFGHSNISAGTSRTLVGRSTNSEGKDVNVRRVLRAIRIFDNDEDKSAEVRINTVSREFEVYRRLLMIVKIRGEDPAARHVQRPIECLPHHHADPSCDFILLEPNTLFSFARLCEPDPKDSVSDEARDTLVLGAGRGLCWISEQGIVLRNVSPESFGAVSLKESSGGPHAVVIDFDHAVFFSPGQSAIRSLEGEWGIIPYRAPEMSYVDTNGLVWYDKGVDVWGFGLVCFGVKKRDYLLPDHEGADLWNPNTKAKFEEQQDDWHLAIATFHEWRSEHDQSFWEIVRGMLQKNPYLRLTAVQVVEKMWQLWPRLP